MCACVCVRMRGWDGGEGQGKAASDALRDWGGALLHPGTCACMWWGAGAAVGERRACWWESHIRC